MNYDELAAECRNNGWIAPSKDRFEDLQGKAYPLRYGVTWNENEELSLKDEWERKLSITYIANLHYRDKSGIANRLERLGLLAKPVPSVQPRAPIAEDKEQTETKQTTEKTMEKIIVRKTFVMGTEVTSANEGQCLTLLSMLTSNEKGLELLPQESVYVKTKKQDIIDARALVVARLDALVAKEQGE